MVLRRVGLPLAALAGYALVAVVSAWPLPLHFQTHLTGPPSGDTGVYVWNVWLFRHELVEHGRLPFFTFDIFALGPTRANLSLHNYTTFANVLALPLIPLVGVVGAFNLVYLTNVALAGWAMFLLARRVWGHAFEAWLAGVAFACSPVLIARGTAHFSLVAAAPLPLFVLALLRARETLDTRWALAAGGLAGWAAFCDAYYGIYCVMIAAAFLGAHVVAYRHEAKAGTHPVVARALDVLIVCVAGLTIAILVRGGAFEIGPWRISMRSLYTPVLVLTTLVIARLMWPVFRRLSLVPLRNVYPVLRFAAATGVVMAGLLSPVLYALGVRIADGRYIDPPVYWRSSPPGVDLLGFVTPNPNHPLVGHAFRAWVTGARPDGFVENVASVSLVALGVIAVALWRARFRPAFGWVALTLGFGVLALGPFVRIAGVNTYVPTPWTLLRYVPLIGSARSPARFSVLVALGVAVLLAGALASLAARWPRRRAVLLACVSVALAFELWPAPRPLYSARIPDIYRTIARDRRDVRVLELPTGIRDGTSSLGNFSALTQFYQTAHGKPLLGGYLSRVSRRRIEFYRRIAVLDALYTLSEGRSLSSRQSQNASTLAPQFITNARIGYVVVHNDRASPELRRFAVETLDLVKIDEEGPIELFVPASTMIW